MPNARTYVFVLWGEQCEELTAAVFVSELRGAGLLVKIVGLSGLRAAGTRGMALVPDITLGEALLLAPRAACVILPCASTTLMRLAHDPRLQEFCEQALTNQAQFVVASSGFRILSAIGISLPQTMTASIVTYPAGGALIDFAQSVAQSLLSA